LDLSICFLPILLLLLTAISSSQTWSLPSWWQNSTNMHRRWSAVKWVMFPLCYRTGPELGHAVA
jgi:hypothetical protein